MERLDHTNIDFERLSELCSPFIQDLVVFVVTRMHDDLESFLKANCRAVDDDEEARTEIAELEAEQLRRARHRRSQQRAALQAQSEQLRGRMQQALEEARRMQAAAEGGKPLPMMKKCKECGTKYNPKKPCPGCIEAMFGPAKGKK